MTFRSCALYLIIVIVSFGCNGPAVDGKKSENYYRGFLARDKVFYSPMGNWFELGRKEIKGAHAGTFQIINQHYAKDKDRCYFMAEALVGADVATLSEVPFPKDTGPAHGSTAEAGWYAKDNRNVYYKGKPIEGSQPQSFAFLISSDANWHQYSEDAGAVYWAGQKI